MASAETKAPLDLAEELKQEGNSYFRGQQWEDAFAAYRKGLECLPVRQSDPKGKRKAEIEDDEVTEDSETPDAAFESIVDTTAEPLDDIAKARAILHGNIAACHLKLGNDKLAIEACSEALLDDPCYVKALQRRSACNERIGSWSSLSSAKEDYQTLLELLPNSNPQRREVERSLKTLEPRLAIAQKRETDEMIDKMKGLGNSFLGNFGLSTDNFKFEPNGQGGYSMNFSR